MSNSKPFKPYNLCLLVLFWLYVMLPLAWGVGSTLQKALALFN
jgi:hypothetical protein